MTRSLSFVALFSLSVLFCSASSLRGRRLDNCVGPQEFFYEALIAVTSYPPVQCSDEESRDISDLLEESMNRALAAQSSDYETKNKICPLPFGHNRRLADEGHNAVFNESSIDQERRELFRGGRFMYLGGGRCRFCSNENLDHRALQHQRRVEEALIHRSVAFRLHESDTTNCVTMRDVLELEACSEDDTRQQFQMAATSLEGLQFQLVVSHTGQCLTVSTDGSEIVQAPCDTSDEMLWFMFYDNLKAQFKSISSGECMEPMPNGMVELRACENSIEEEQFFILSRGQVVQSSHPCERTYAGVSAESFMNGDVSRWEEGRLGQAHRNISNYLGPYYPGDQPRRVFDLPEGTLEAGISFVFFEFDTDMSNSSLHGDSIGKFGDNGDDPLSVLINNVELDFKELVDNKELSETYEQIEWEYLDQKKYPVASGTTIGGIQWAILKGVEGDFGSDTDNDRQSAFLLQGAPRILFDHTHRLDVRFLLKEGGKASSYGFRDIIVSAATYNATGCYEENNETDLIEPWTPWEMFRGEVEPLLQDALRKDLIDAYSEQTNHCLENVKPIVNVNLIQKLEWSRAKPRCD